MTQDPTRTAEFMTDPVTRRRISLRVVPDENPENAALEIDSWLPAGWRDPWRHLHPHQEERVSVVAGRLLAEIDGWSRTYSPGESFIIPRGVEHHLSVDGDGFAHIVSNVTPPLSTADLEVVLHRLGRRSFNRKGRSRALLEAIVAREFRRELVIVEPRPFGRGRPLARLLATFRYRRLMARLTAEPESVVSDDAHASRDPAASRRGLPISDVHHLGRRE
jgi:quercetin dioxygenase-like cupin family protein